MVVNLHTNQSMDDEPKTLLSPRRTVISMPHDMTEWKLVCLGLNVGLVEDPPSINLWEITCT
jgi:hypothetical protein